MFTNKIEVLDSNILTEIFFFLNQMDLIHTSRVNKRFHFIGSNSELQKNAANQSPDKALSSFISKFVYLDTSVTMLPENQLAIGCCNGTIQIWDYEKQRIIKSISAFANLLDDKQVISTAFIGSEKIAASAYKNAIRIYQYKTGELLNEIKLGFSIRCITYLGNDELALGSYEGFIEIFNLKTFKNTQALCNSKHWVLNIAQISDCELASCSQDGIVRLWNYKNGELIIELKNNIECNWAYNVINLNNNKIGSCHDDGFRVWDYKKGECLKFLAIKPREFEKEVLVANQIKKIRAEVKCTTAIKISKEKVICGYGTGVIRVWNFITGECLQEINDHRRAILYTHEAPDLSSTVSYSMGL